MLLLANTCVFFHLSIAFLRIRFIQSLSQSINLFIFIRTLSNLLIRLLCLILLKWKLFRFNLIFFDNFILYFFCYYFDILIHSLKHNWRIFRFRIYLELFFALFFWIKKSCVILNKILLINLIVVWHRWITLIFGLSYFFLFRNNIHFAWYLIIY